MEMDGRDFAKCQKSKRMDIMRILEFVNEEKDKIWNSGHLLEWKKRPKRAEGMQ